MSRILFCELSPTTYEISIKKAVLIRKIKDILNGITFAKTIDNNTLPILCKEHLSPVMRKLHGVDEQLQKNKETNLIIASSKINGLIIHPGETFSFWEMVGRPTAKEGYKEGLAISGKKGLSKGIGGGICQLANLIHWLVLHSPLEVTEIHHHSDALFPDDNRKVPFGTGTSVFYKLLDYRFKNNLDYDVQINVRVENNYLYGELYSQKSFNVRYRLSEEDNHFVKEKDGYYRVSKVYKSEIDSNGNVNKSLILDNHSKVMYDYSLIPKEQIRENE